ncbi:type I-U CRISPR-associated protein Cas7 [Micromonospora zingiberis]|uniref:Type I-U CRISPR-associated protein Cas7 n=1 Tax=Micromonospora zingiberis TaxID=2053011 RepID=A0A4R0G0L1_9ACTN|nr:type I-U CRISPR-associated RAMP protein Csb1/Cas7u [Micromonospora zingiberis]TCB89407.1 type I-U CRISPR-associated protein Cas7 [Micromonospora zingiberis]
MASVELVDRLVAAVGEQRRESGLVVEAVYQPVGGVGGKVMPPTFPPPERGGSPYLLEERWIDGERMLTVVVDQVPSQANRVEEALLAARDGGRLSVPIFEMVVDGVRLTSLQFPHRYADAYLRDSEVDGVRFDDSPVGKSLRSTTVLDVRPLYAREPYSLLFGAWDSHRKGRWPRFARLYQSMMYGLDPIVGDRRSGRFDPMNLTGAVDDKAKAEADWRFVPEGQKAKGGRLSEIGHGHIAPNPAHGGVTVREVRRRAWVSFASLERLRFGEASAEAAGLARAALAALALVGDRLAFGRPSVSLRSGCDLTRISETVAFEVAGGELEPIEVSVADAITAFLALRQRAAAAGVPMADDVVAVTPIRQLREAMVYARTQAVADAEE